MISRIRERQPLRVDQRVVHPTLAHRQLRVRPKLHHDALLHHRDRIRRLNRRQSMRDDQRGPSRH